MFKLSLKKPFTVHIFICRFFLRQFYKTAQYESRGSDAMYCKFRVKHNDGKISQKMRYRKAKDYVEMFGGVVVDAF